MSLETLINQSKIWLFGRRMDDIKLDQTAYRLIDTVSKGNKANTPPSMGSNNFLLDQLQDPDAVFARIYAFSYESNFYDIKPAVFLVHGEGIDPEGANFTFTADQTVYSRMPAETGRTGLSSVSGAFARGMKVWAYDRADFTLRLDVEGGSFDTLLLSSELGEWDVAARSSGSVVRSAGSVARAAGSVARAAGSVARARKSGGSGE